MPPHDLLFFSWLPFFYFNLLVGFDRERARCDALRFVGVTL